MQSPAWVELRKVGDAQIQSRRGKHLTGPIKEGVSIYQQQFELGEAAGIELFFKLPEIVMDAARTIIKENEQTNEPEAPAV